MPHQCTSCGRVFDDGSKEMLSGCPECGGKKFQFRPSGTSPDSDSRTSPRSNSRTSPGSKSPGSKSPGSSPASSERNSGSSATEREPTPPESNRIEHESDPSGSEPAGYAADSTSAGGNRPSAGSNRPSAGSNRPSAGASSDEDGNDGEVVPTAEKSDPPEDRAQADARSGFVSEEELPRAEEPSTASAESPAADSDSPADPERQDVERPDLSQLREELNSQFESIKIVSQGQYELNLMELYDRQEYIISLQEDGRYVIEMPDAWGPDDE